LTLANFLLYYSSSLGLFHIGASTRREYSPASRREYTVHIDAINIARDLWWSATIKFKWCLLLVIARLYM